MKRYSGNILTRQMYYIFETIKINKDKKVKQKKINLT